VRIPERLELRTGLRRYYTTYYRDVLGIPTWAELVVLREEEERHEASRLTRLRQILNTDLRGWRVLNLGCGTGGFNEAAAAAGMRVVGVDADVGAIGICAMRDGVPASRFAGGQSERLPFRSDSFDLVYCFSVIEHVASVEASVSEMVRVTRPGGAVYVHTPNAWSWYEGHYKVFWIPFMPPPLARWYLALRGRPTAYLQTLRRLTPGRLRRAFAAAGVRHVEFHAGTAARETAGRLGPPVRLYYRLSGMSPFIEIVARKP
jgi:2-polyprenyl-3-methyl-5-hydroxy-6-metoxy-1,4-benzoquinol methylase